MKKLLATSIAVLVLTLVTASFGNDSIVWETIPPPTATYLYQNDGITKITPGTTGGSGSGVGGFVQLIYCGTTYDGLNIANTDGHAGDDVVVATEYVGDSVMSRAGEFYGTYSSSYAQSSVFVIRFFTAPSGNYAGGAIPLTGYYGFEQFTQTQDPTSDGASEEFNISPSQTASTPVAVPEPSAAILMMLGLATVGFRRRFLKK